MSPLKARCTLPVYTGHDTGALTDNTHHNTSHPSWGGLTSSSNYRKKVSLNKPGSEIVRVMMRTRGVAAASKVLLVQRLTEWDWDAGRAGCCQLKTSAAVRICRNSDVSADVRFLHRRRHALHSTRPPPRCTDSCSCTRVDSIKQTSKLRLFPQGKNETQHARTLTC